MAQIKVKKDVILTKFSIEESMAMVNSQPYLKHTKNHFNLTKEEMEIIEKENIEWAMS